MKTAIVTKYGGPEVIQIIETTKPTPKPNEVLVKIKAFGVTSGDVRIRSAKFPKGFAIPAKLALGIFGPRNKVLGSEFSGVVEEIGSEVKDFKIDDNVIGFRVFNINAEYACIKDSAAITQMPENLSFEEAASIPFGASTALYFLKMANLKSDQSVLINGASGSVGSNAVQIAKAMNTAVTGVCSGSNTEFVKSLGASQTIDYKTTDLKTIATKYDVIFDTVGNLRFDEVKHLLNTGGRFLQAVATFGELFAKKDREDGKRFLTGTAPEKKEDLNRIVEMVLQGKLKPCVDKVFDFQDIAKAHEYVETGRKKGGVVVRVGD
jgi:NADPH:quinone reductase-like Zn-dependent oxidoreductase